MQVMARALGRIILKKTRQKDVVLSIQYTDDMKVKVCDFRLLRGQSDDSGLGEVDMTLEGFVRRGEGEVAGVGGIEGSYRVIETPDGFEDGAAGDVDKAHGAEVASVIEEGLERVDFVGNGCGGQGGGALATR